MALQVCKLKNSYLAKGKLHLIKKRGWGPANGNALMSLMIQFFCESAPVDRTPSKYNGLDIEDFDKTVHMKDLCEECVKAVRATMK